MTYAETIAYLFQNLPMFQRIGDAAIKKDLTNIRKLCDLLGHPERTFPSIHIAGTNGKGSTSHMLASVFQTAGYKTGLYTSPHYADFRERIRVNGEMIPKASVTRFVQRYKESWQAIAPSFFEISFAMALYHFQKSEVDIAIIETGLGGRLDSTNIITPRLSVITNIGFDHMNMLGHTLPEIAFEKAGIIKPGVPVVIGEWNKLTAPVFMSKAKDMQVPICFASKHIALSPKTQLLTKHSWSVKSSLPDIPAHIVTDLTGPYQKQNIATILAAMHSYNQYYADYSISTASIRKGLSRVKANTGMMGRWMILQKAPLVITDAAHNEHGMEAMLPALLKINTTQKHFVLGFVNDKEIDKILRHFPKDGCYYWCAPEIPRAKPVMETQQTGQMTGLQGERFTSVSKAFQTARKNASARDLIFVGGSSYVVGDFLAWWNKKTGT